MRPHASADDVAEIVGLDIGAISRQAVYDALGVFVEHGLVRRIQPAGSPARYEDRANDNHHHLICRDCDQLVDVDCAVGTTPCLTASNDQGYEIDEAEVVYWGRCPDCRAKDATRRRLGSASTHQRSPRSIRTASTPPLTTRKRNP